MLALAERATALPHLRAGVEWLAENMPPDTYLFTNDLAIKHSVGGRITPTERGFLTRDVARIMRGEVPPIAATPGSTIAIRIRPLHFADEVSKKLDNNPAIRWVKTFVGEGEKLLVYRVLATKDGE